jgi:hypothetical protein
MTDGFSNDSLVDVGSVELFVVVVVVIVIVLHRVVD